MLGCDCTSLTANLTRMHMYRKCRGRRGSKTSRNNHAHTSITYEVAIAVEAPRCTIEHASKMDPLAKITDTNLSRGHVSGVCCTYPRSHFILHRKQVHPQENLRNAVMSVRYNVSVRHLALTWPRITLVLDACLQRDYAFHLQIFGIPQTNICLWSCAGV